MKDTPEEFRSLLTSLPQMVFIADNEGQTTYLNQQWYDYTGLKEEVNLATMSKILHPDDQDVIFKTWIEANKLGKTWTQEYRIRRHDGVYRWHLGRSAPQKDSRGVIQRWVGTITDIEDQKNIEKILKETKENLEQIVTERTRELTQANAFLDTVIENIPNMIFVKDAEDLKFVRFNRAGEELIGVPHGSLIGKGDYDFFPPQEAAAFQEKDRVVIAGRVVVDIPEEPISTASGPRILHTKKIPVFDSAGHPRYLVGISEDVTELKKIEKERIQFIENRIAKQESDRTSERFKFLSEASAVLGSTLEYETTLSNLTKLSVPAIADSCAVDLIQPDRTLKRISVSYAGLGPEKEKVAWDLRAQCSDNENVRSGPFSVIKTGKAELISVITDETAKTSAISEDHFQMIKQIGMRSYICAPIRVRGEILGTLTLTTNSNSNRIFSQADLHLAEEIGERAGVAIENARLYKEARNLNRVKDEFLATLSHELRTPLNVILGHAEILKSEVDELSRDQIQMSIDAIYRNAKTQTGLIADLLDVSSIITGKVSYKPAQVIPQDTVNNIISSLQSTAEAKGVILTLDAAQAPAIALADPTRLHQIIWNLISNAVKFTPAGGKVSVKVSKSEHEWTITVTDTGRGIDPEFLPYVFDRFRQEDASTTRRYGGLGLGLSIVRHLVELHGGSVQASSQGKDQGASFKVTLPLMGSFSAPEPSAKKGLLTESVPNTKNKSELKNVKILLVEDSEDSRLLICLILKKAGAIVVEADSAKQARERLESFIPDIIISDVGMPEENGIEFIQKLRAEVSKCQTIPAIALTAYVRAEEKESVVKAGFQSHVGKPVSADTLLNEISRFLKKN